VKTVLLYRISGDVSDVSIVSLPVPMGREVSIAKNKKRKSITDKICLLGEASGGNGHSRHEPMVLLRSVLSVFIELIKG
jgi:hypothetical protein